MIAKSKPASYAWQTNTATSSVNVCACQVSKRTDSLTFITLAICWNMAVPKLRPRFVSHLIREQS